MAFLAVVAFFLSQSSSSGKSLGVKASTSIALITVRNKQKNPTLLLDWHLQNAIRKLGTESAQGRCPCFWDLWILRDLFLYYCTIQQLKILAK